MSASISPASGLAVEASVTCEGPHYTVHLDYSPLPGGNLPSKGEEFIVSVVVNDVVGKRLASYAAGVLIM